MINNVTLMGRLTAAPELKTTQNGTSVTSFVIAVERRRKKEGEQTTDFIDCVAWQNNAEFVTRYFTKGDMICVIGEVQTRNYTDKNGNKRKVVEIVVDRASFCGGKSNKSKEPENNNNIEI